MKAAGQRRTSAFLLTVVGSTALLKDTPPAKIVAAIHVVTNGGTGHVTQVMRRLMDRVAVEAGQHQRTRARLAALSDRETEVVRAIAGGLSNAEMGPALFMSVATVKNPRQQHSEQAGPGQPDADRPAGITRQEMTEMRAEFPSGERGPYDEIKRRPRVACHPQRQHPDLADRSHATAHRR